MICFGYMKNFSYIYYVNKLKLKSMKSQFEIWLEKVNEKEKSIGMPITITKNTNPYQYQKVKNT